MSHIEAQLNRGCELVDVLPAGARRTDEAFLDFAFVDFNAWGDADHGYAPVRYLFASTLPSSTAGWSNGSTPSRCAAMIVSSMNCIKSSPNLASSRRSIMMVRNGQPFLAS